MRRVPKLTACPECGVLLQAGVGPHRLAHHGCRPAVTVEDLAGAIRKRMMQQILTGEMGSAEAAKALRAMEGPGPGRPTKEKPGRRREVEEGDGSDENERVRRMLTAPVKVA